MRGAPRAAREARALLYFPALYNRLAGWNLARRSCPTHSYPSGPGIQPRSSHTPRHLPWGQQDQDWGVGPCQEPQLCRALNARSCSQVPRTEAPTPASATPQEPWPGEREWAWAWGRVGSLQGCGGGGPLQVALGSNPCPLGFLSIPLEPLSLALAGPTTPSPTSRPPWAVDPAFAERYAPDKTSTVLTRHSQPATPTPLQNRTSIVQAAAGGGTGGGSGNNGKTPVCHQCHKVIRWVALFHSYPGLSCPGAQPWHLSDLCSPVCLPTHLSCHNRKINIQFPVGVGVETWPGSSDSESCITYRPLPNISCYQHLSWSDGGSASGMSMLHLWTHCPLGREGTAPSPTASLPPACCLSLC